MHLSFGFFMFTKIISSVQLLYIHETTLTYMPMFPAIHSNTQMTTFFCNKIYIFLIEILIKYNKIDNKKNTEKQFFISVFHIFLYYCCCWSCRLNEFEIIF